MFQQNLPSHIGNHVPGDLYEQLSHSQGRSLSHWGGWRHYKFILVCITRGSLIFTITLTAAFHTELTIRYHELRLKESETFFLIEGMESKSLGISHSFSANSLRLVYQPVKSFTVSWGIEIYLSAEVGQIIKLGKIYWSVMLDFTTFKAGMVWYSVVSNIKRSEHRRESLMSLWSDSRIQKKMH